MEIKDVENLAELAKIQLSDAEKGTLVKDMEGILEYVKVIENVEVPDVVPVYDHRNVWREDLPAQTGIIEPREFSEELIKKQFPESQDGFLKVKKIL